MASGEVESLTRKVLQQILRVARLVSRAWARFRRFTGVISRFFVDVLSPVFVLWPWLIGAMAFGLLLSSPQGSALAEQSTLGSIGAVMAVVAIITAGLLVALSCLLALLAKAASGGRLGAVLHPQSRSVGLFGAMNVVWLAVIACSYGTLFAASTNVAVAWGATGIVLGIILGAALGWWHASADSASLSQRLLRSAGRHRLMLALVTALVASLPLAVGGLIATSQPLVLAKFGPLLIGMMGFAALSTLFGAVLVSVPLCLRAPWLGVWFLACVFLWQASRPLAVDSVNPLLREAMLTADEGARNTSECRKQPSTLRGALASKLTQPKVADRDSEEGRTIYLVSAEGGGIRAAYWTAVSLSLIDGWTDDRFANEVATLSGVSGGSLGIATWLAARERQDLQPAERLELVKRFLATDFLSPLIGGLLFLDVPKLVFGSLWFDARRDHVFEKGIADRWMEVGKTDFFLRSISQLCIQGFADPPAVFFNATEVTTGGYVPLSRTRLTSRAGTASALDVHISSTTLARAPVAQIVHISARFPYLSPASEVGVSVADMFDDSESERLRRLREDGEISDAQMEEGLARLDLELEQLRSEGLESRIGVLVDGGYFDNTGLVPTREAIAQISERRSSEAKRKAGTRKPFTAARVKLLHLANEPGRMCQPLPADWVARLSKAARRYLEVTRSDLRCVHEVQELEASFLPAPMRWFTAPLESILSVRGAHSSGQLARAVSEVSRLERSGSGVATFPFEGSVFVLSVGEELSAVAGGSVSSQHRAEWNTNDRPLLDVTATEALARQLAELASTSREAKMVPEEAVKSFEAKVDKWRRQTINQWETIKCANHVRAAPPPLGWSLNEQNRKLLDCFAARAAIRSGIGVAQFPDTAELLPDKPRARR